MPHALWTWKGIVHMRASSSFWGDPPSQSTFTQCELVTFVSDLYPNLPVLFHNAQDRFVTVGHTALSPRLKLVKDLRLRR